jgi:ribose 5-phosphate isomerase A
MLKRMDLEIGKKSAGDKAATLIENGMIVGLGTGSTAAYFIKALIEKCKQGLHIKAVASSHRSLQMAKEGGIPVFEISEVSHIDVTVDGADEIDHQKRMIKGGGGAHVKEKILATSSAEMIVIVDESKVVQTLGKAKLPIEILPYGSLFTQKKIEALGLFGKWRAAKANQLNQELFITENGNYLFDIDFKAPVKNPEKLDELLLQIPGVVDTGFFFKIAKKVIIGKSDGCIDFL